MTKYAALASKAAIPQTEPLDSRQVKNNQGGFVYEVDAWQRLTRFLILGSDANTYYQTAKELTRQNAAVVEECWVKNPSLAAGLICGVSTAGRAPKNDPAIFALALGVISTNAEARHWALLSVPTVCRTGTHLFQFVATARALGKGFGRGMKRAIAKWYNDKSVDAVAYQVVKYRQREKLTHENLLDLSHPKTSDADRNALYKWIIGKVNMKDLPAGAFAEAQFVDEGTLPSIIVAHENAMKTTAAKELLPILAANKSLPWEALPTWANADIDVQKALLPNMGLTALIRNLGNLTRIGVITPMSTEEKIVRDKLASEQDLHKSRVHPMAVLVAQKVYASGRGIAHGGKTPASWTPNQKIVDVLDDAFYKAFKNVEPSGKRFVIGIDVSASMSAPISGSAVLSCCEAAAALAMVTARTEPYTFVGRFNQGFQPVTFSERSRMDDVLRQTRSINGGGTDCSLPMQYAMQNKIDADAFIVITDNETAHGRIHPAQALKEYRRAMNKPTAKLIVIAMTATRFSIADPKDAGMLDICGFDASMPGLITEFVRA